MPYTRCYYELIILEKTLGQPSSTRDHSDAVNLSKAVRTWPFEEVPRHKTTKCSRVGPLHYLDYSTTNITRVSLLLNTELLKQSAANMLVS